MEALHYFRVLFKTNSVFTPFLFSALGAAALCRFVRFPSFLSGKKGLWLAIALGLLLRVGWLGLSSHEPQTAWNPTHMLESDVTNVHAIELAQGIWFRGSDGQPSGRRPIGYPLFLGLLYKIFGAHSWVVWVSNLALFAATCALVWAMTKLIFSEAAASLTAFFFAIYPVSVYSIKLATDEHLFMPLWYLGLWLLLRALKGDSVRSLVFWCGLIFGYATMTRTHTIFMPFTVALTFFLMRQNWKKVAAAFFLTALVMQLVNLPWAVRNYKVWGVPVLYTATAHYVYAQVNSTANAPGNGHIPLTGEEGYSEDLERARASGNQGLYHALCNRQMKKWILSHPARFLDMGLGRLFIFMGWDRGGGVWPIWFQFYDGSYDPARPLPNKALFEEAAHAAYYALFFVFWSGVAFLALRWKTLSEATRSSLLVLGSVFLFWFFEQMIIYPDRKYRFPLEPLMMMPAAYFLAHLARRKA